jgi:hypothetical protein
MAVATRTETFERVITGNVDWAITPNGSTEPAIEASSELIFYRKMGSIVIPEMYEVLYARLPGDSSHKITLRHGWKPVLRGALEIAGPRSSSHFRHYVGDDEHYRPQSPSTRHVGDVAWEWEQTGSWLNADNNPDKIPTLGKVVKQFPEVAPLNPSSGDAQLLLAIAKAIK